MAFIITKDIIGDDAYTGEVFARLDESTEKCTIPFRLFDDDGELYFEGLGSNSSSFAPLDNFGSGFGCTDIQYFENNKWESL
jgi:hypothetical protein